MLEKNIIAVLLIFKIILHETESPTTSISVASSFSCPSKHTRSLRALVFSTSVLDMALKVWQMSEENIFKSGAFRTFSDTWNNHNLKKEETLPMKSQGLSQSWKGYSLSKSQRYYLL